MSVEVRAEGGAARGEPRRWPILGAVCVALAVIVVDTTVLNVALPTIEDDLGAGPAALQGVVNAYVVVFAGLLVVAGLLADRHGRRRAVVAGLAVLAAASLAAASAPDAASLIAARAAMGAGAALVMPGTLAILVHAFAAEERVKALAVWSAVGSAVMAAGPIAGGVLVERWGWPGIFVANAALAAAAAVLIRWTVPESRDRRNRRVDLLGGAAVTVTMGALVAAVVSASDRGLSSPLTLGCCAVALAAGAGFWARNRRAASPVVDTALYRDRRFCGASAAVAVLAVGTGSVLFVLTQYLQHVLELSPSRAGLAVLPLAVGVTLGSPFGVRLVPRAGHRRTIITGFLVTASGFAVLATLTPGSPYLTTAAGLLLAGLGSGVASPAVHATVLGAVPPDRAGMGSALNDTHQQLGIALGVAAIGGVVAAGYRAFVPSRLGGGSDPSLGGTLAGLDPRRDDAVHAAQLAYTQAQSIAMVLCALLAVAGAAIAWYVLAPDRRTSESLPASLW